MKRIKRIIALLVAAAMLAVPTLAAEDQAAQPISPWAYSSLADIYALGMWKESYYTCILDPVTSAQMEQITSIVSAKLALLNLPVRQPTDLEKGLVLDGTRGGVVNALHQAAADYALGSEVGYPDKFLPSLGVVTPDATGNYHLDRVCTLQEALVMARRLILAAYDSQDAGSKGLLWKATNGQNTLYLLGTIHVDRGNVYPFHKNLRDALAQSQDTILELDFGDTEGMQPFLEMQYYSDGTTLKDHVSPQLYTDAIKAGTALGLTEAQTAAYKPWALANVFQSTSLSSSEEGAGGSGAEAPMVVDSYIYSNSINLGHTVAGCETYVLQGNVFDTLSASYQETYLSSILKSYFGEVTDAGVSDSTTETQIDGMLTAWKNGDIASMETYLGKDQILASNDELNVNLLLKRDPGMIAYADTYLKQDRGHTGFMAVGAAHMVGNTGIVQGLKNLGYTVEQIH